MKAAVVAVFSLSSMEVGAQDRARLSPAQQEALVALARLYGVTRYFCPGDAGLRVASVILRPLMRDLAPLAWDFVMRSTTRFIHLGGANDHHRIIHAGGPAIDQSLCAGCLIAADHADRM